METVKGVIIPMFFAVLSVFAAIWTTYLDYSRGIQLENELRISIESEIVRLEYQHDSINRLANDELAILELIQKKNRKDKSIEYSIDSLKILVRNSDSYFTEELSHYYKKLRKELIPKSDPSFFSKSFIMDNITNVIYALLIGILLYFFLRFINSVTLKQSAFSKEQLLYYEKLLENQNEKIGAIVEYFALNSHDNELGQLLLNLRETDGNMKWLVSKFLSKKIGLDFVGSSKEEIIIADNNLGTFQTILENVINECENNICWTNPRLPEEWFKEAKKGQDVDDYDTDNLFRYRLDDFTLLRCFANSRVEKTRIINISNTKFNKLIGKSLLQADPKTKLRYAKYLKHFIRLNEKEIPNCKLLFVNYSKIAGIDPQIQKADFGIYDNKIVMGINSRIFLKLNDSKYINAIKKLHDENSQAVYRSDSIVNLFKKNTSIDINILPK
jgi:hypothetical protein